MNYQEKCIIPNERFNISSLRRDIHILYPHIELFPKLKCLIKYIDLLTQINPSTY